MVVPILPTPYGTELDIPIRELYPAIVAFERFNANHTLQEVLDQRHIPHYVFADPSFPVNSELIRDFLADRIVHSFFQSDLHFKVLKANISEMNFRRSLKNVLSHEEYTADFISDWVKLLDPKFRNLADSK